MEVHAVCIRLLANAGAAGIEVCRKSDDGSAFIRFIVASLVSLLLFFIVIRDITLTPYYLYTHVLD